MQNPEQADALLLAGCPQEIAAAASHVVGQQAKVLEKRPDNCLVLVLQSPKQGQAAVTPHMMGRELIVAGQHAKDFAATEAASRHQGVGS
jgi:hypothetical protein